MTEMNCPLCHKILYSELGKACKMCGMALDDKGKDFCSKGCRKKYKQINNLHSLSILTKLKEVK